MIFSLNTLDLKSLTSKVFSNENLESIKTFNTYVRGKKSVKKREKLS